MLGTLELNQILYIILSGITHGDGLNFNRALLFLTSPQTPDELTCAMAVGPANREEAHRIWEDMTAQKLDLEQLLYSCTTESWDPMSHWLMKQLVDLRISLSLNASRPKETQVEQSLESLLVECILSGRPFLSNSLLVSTAFEGETGPKQIPFSHLAIVPLTLKGRALGAIVADNHYNQRVVAKRELGSLTTLANLAAIAIDKARLHQKLKELAVLDGLTRLNNRRHYELTLRKELARAGRERRRVSLLLLDIDFFKACNDTYGHAIGDRVLVDLAAIIESGVRAGDFVARYGGEEFVVLLTGNATQREAYQVALKLKSKVETSSLSSIPAGEITVSIGVATARADRVDREGLFALADAALYEAKKQGRNRVCLAEANA